MAQIINITSEALQATIRRLLPSQQGFGEDLQASNVIQPVIDITATAEGSQLPVDLARALSFGNVTSINLTSSGSITPTPGFYRLRGVISILETASGGEDVVIQLQNGVGVKTIAQYFANTASQGTNHIQDVVYDLFIDTGDQINFALTANTRFVGAYWPVADRYGTITNPSGFTFE